MSTPYRNELLQLYREFLEVTLRPGKPPKIEARGIAARIQCVEAAARLADQLDALVSLAVDTLPYADGYGPDPVFLQGTGHDAIAAALNATAEQIRAAMLAGEQVEDFPFQLRRRDCVHGGDR